MKTAEDLLIEINLAARITRDPRLLALLADIKELLESSPPAPSRMIPLDAPAGRLPRARTAMPSREAQIKKANYMREWMRRKRQKDRDAKNAIINSTSANPDRDHSSVPRVQGVVQEENHAESHPPKNDLDLDSLKWN